MTDKHPFEDVLLQISHILQFIRENFSKGTESDEVSPEILTKLKRLKDQVKNFRARGDQFVANSSVTHKDLEALINISSSPLRIQDQLFLKLVEDMKGKIENAQKEYSQKVQGVEKGTKIPKADEVVEEDPEFGKKRKKKFKRFGINEKWKPL